MNLYYKRKQKRISQLIKRKLNEIFQKDNHYYYKLEKFIITIVKVEINFNFRVAHVKVTSFCSNSICNKIIRNLNNTSSYYRYLLNKILKLKYSLKLRFYL